MRDFKKYYILNTEPEILYSALTTEATIILWTGENAQMQAIEGTEFYLWDDSIVGKNISFEPNKKIIQQWYFGDQTEPSIVTIILHDNKGKTSVEVRHTNIPDEDFDEIVKGWNEIYFGSLLEFYKD